MRRKTVAILALALVFALMLTACAVRKPLQTPEQQEPNTTGLYNDNRGMGTTTGTGTGYTNPYDANYGGNNDYRTIGGTNNSSNFGLNNTGTATTQADRLAKSCETVSGVNNATVVVSGNTAYVGVDTTGNRDGKNVAYGTANNVSTVKQQCAQKVRAANPQIQTVYVSTDANFFDRLRRVGDGIRNGNAAGGFRNELDGLVKGLTPEKF